MRCPWHLPADFLSHPHFGESSPKSSLALWRTLPMPQSPAASPVAASRPPDLICSCPRAKIPGSLCALGIAAPSDGGFVSSSMCCDSAAYAPVRGFPPVRRNGPGTSWASAIRGGAQVIRSRARLQDHARAWSGVADLQIRGFADITGGARAIEPAMPAVTGVVAGWQPVMAQVPTRNAESVQALQWRC
jgi:hypothetical protein